MDGLPVVRAGRPGGPDRVIMGNMNLRGPAELPPEAAGSPPLPREATLLAAARRGDREAAGELLLAHHGPVLRVCRFLLGPAGDAEGAAQEVFLRALRSLGRFQGTGSFRSWLAAIATHLCRDRLRRLRLIPFSSLDDAGGGAEQELGGACGGSPSPERHAMAREAADLVSREVAALPPRQREAFTLRFFAELELDDIASAMSVDVGTVKTHLHRAVHRVRRAVEEARP